VVVLDLHDLIPRAECPAEALDPDLARRVRRVLQLDIEGAGTEATTVHWQSTWMSRLLQFKLMGGRPPPRQIVSPWDATDRAADLRRLPASVLTQRGLRDAAMARLEHA
jgi:hypothetical protein